VIARRPQAHLKNGRSGPLALYVEDGTAKRIRATPAPAKGNVRGAIEG